MVMRVPTGSIPTGVKFTQQNYFVQDEKPERLTIKEEILYSHYRENVWNGRNQ